MPVSKRVTLGLPPKKFRRSKTKTKLEGTKAEEMRKLTVQSTKRIELENAQDLVERKAGIKRAVRLANKIGRTTLLSRTLSEIETWAQAGKENCKFAFLLEEADLFGEEFGVFGDDIFWFDDETLAEKAAASLTRALVKEGFRPDIDADEYKIEGWVYWGPRKVASRQKAG